MKLCAKNHPAICHDEDDCPLCLCAQERELQRGAKEAALDSSYKWKEESRKWKIGARINLGFYALAVVVICYLCVCK